MKIFKYDKYIIDLFIMPNSNRIRLRLYNIYKTDKYTNIKSYIEHRYNDSESINETIFRILYNVKARPVCKVCGKPVKYIGKPKSKGLFAKYCCASCRAKDTYTYRDNNVLKAKETKLQRYGSETYNNIEQIAKTKLQRYGDSGYVNSEQIKETKLQRYGSATYNNIEQIHETKLQKYGSETYVNAAKAKETKLQRYGSETYNNREQASETNIERYGYNTPLKNENIKKQIKETNINIYGVSNPAKCDIIKEKIINTCIIKYGVKHYTQTIECQNKIISSKRNNNTFNTSKPETESYKLLQQVFPLTEYQYTSDLYPYNCDFYIPEIDTYIECNYHWTHGGHAYNKDTDIEQLNEWIEKSQTSNFYKNAIQTWTVRDVKKRNVAKQNNLNYTEFWNIDELKQWITQK